MLSRFFETGPKRWLLQSNGDGHGQHLFGSNTQKFEDNIDPDKMDLYQQLKSQYFLTEDCEFGKRQPNRYKVECEGHQMISLCSKSYCVFNRSTHKVTMSSKGFKRSPFIDVTRISNSKNNNSRNLR